MQVSSKADYPVQVIPEAQEHPGPSAQFFVGIFRVILNHTVDVVFVPDISAFAPPWDHRRLPPDVDVLTTAEEARFATAMLNSYVVTPNEALAGSVQCRELSAEDESETTTDVIFYVEPAAFARYATDLASLTGLVSANWSGKTVSALRGYEVITFLERRVVASPLLRPYDAIMLGRPGAGHETGP